MQKSVLILGASGRFGRHVAEAFWNAGWSIKAFQRGADDLDTAAQGADVIIAAWNPLYPDWATQLPTLHAQIQSAAKASGSLVIVPGNLYVFGADTPAPWGADTPHLAQNPLGRIRVEMEESYRNSGVQTVILRSGDFIDTQASGNWLDKAMLPSVPKGRFTYPGGLEVAHSWAYLPDLARAAVLLAEMRKDLQQFEDIPFSGHTVTAEDFADVLTDLSGRKVRAQRMRWLPLHLARPFWPMARCLLELRYLWDVPHRLDASRFDALCPQFDETPFEEAIAQAAAPWLQAVQSAQPSVIQPKDQPRLAGDG